MMPIQKNIPLADHSTMGIGGPAEYFAAADSDGQLVSLVEYARHRGIRHAIIGDGSNVLFSDAGFSGLVIRASGMRCDVEGVRITAFAGTSLSRVVARAAEAELSGLEWAVGIPGTVGGAIFGNAGACGGQIQDAADSVEVLDINGATREYGARDCGFSYRFSAFKKNGGIITGAAFRLIRGDKKTIRARMREILRQRSARVPEHVRSIGSIFQNITRHSDIAALCAKDEQICLLSEEKWGGKVAVAYLIDSLHLRGAHVGGACISGKHANIIINDGNATARDMEALIGMIKEKVHAAYGIELEEEIRRIGGQTK